MPGQTWPLTDKYTITYLIQYVTTCIALTNNFLSVPPFFVYCSGSQTLAVV